MKIFDKFLKVLKTDRNTFLTYIFTLLSLYIVVDRLSELFILFFSGIGASYWGPIKYTLALACPIFAFLFCYSSKFVKSQSTKLSFFYLYTTALYIITISMIVQWTNSSIWLWLLSIPNYTTIATEFPSLFKPALTAIALYLPLVTFYPLIKFLYATVNDTKSLRESIFDYKGINLSPSKETVGAYACEVSFLKDADSGKTVKFSEKSRFSSLLVVGPSGSGKTSMVFEPMMAKDLEKKAFFKQVSKELAFTALKTGLASLTGPYDNDYINKNFNLNMLSTNSYNLSTYKAFMNKMIYAENSGEIIYRNIGLTSISPDYETISRMKNVAENLNISYKLIDANDKNSLGLNPFIYDNPLHTAIAISSVLKGMISTINMENSIVFEEKASFQAVENITILLKEMYPRVNSGALPTLEDILKLLQNFDLIEDLCNQLEEIPELKEKYSVLLGYFKKYFFKDSKVLATTEKYVYPAITLLDNLLRNPSMKSILCNKTNNINFDKVLQNGDVVFVCTRRGDLGAASSKALGLFFLLLMQFSVLRRPGNENTRIPYTLYVDEYPDYNNPSLEPLFTLYRKYKVATTISAQTLEQLTLKEQSNMKRIIITNCASKIVFGNNTPEENEWWSKEFGVKRDWKFSTAYDTSKGNYDSKLGGISYGWTNQLAEGKIQTTGFKKCSYKIRNDKGGFSIGTASLDFLDVKYKTSQKDKSYNFSKFNTSSTKKVNETSTKHEKKPVFASTTESLPFEIDPIQINNSDIKFEYDNEDAIIFDLKRDKKKK